MKGISLMKLSSSRRSLRRPYTVLTGGKELELKAGSSKATHMVFPASVPTPEFFHFPAGGCSVLTFPFLLSELLHPCCLYDQFRSHLLCLSWCKVLSSFWKQTPECDIKAVSEAFLGCPSGATLQGEVGGTGFALSPVREAQVIFGRCHGAWRGCCPRDDAGIHWGVAGGH